MSVFLCRKNIGLAGSVGRSLQLVLQVVGPTPMLGHSNFSALSMLVHFNINEDIWLGLVEPSSRISGWAWLSTAPGYLVVFG